MTHLPKHLKSLIAPLKHKRLHQDLIKSLRHVTLDRTPHPHPPLNKKRYQKIVAKPKKKASGPLTPKEITQYYETHRKTSLPFSNDHYLKHLDGVHDSTDQPHPLFSLARPLLIIKDRLLTFFKQKNLPTDIDLPTHQPPLERKKTTKKVASIDNSVDTTPSRLSTGTINAEADLKMRLKMQQKVKENPDENPHAKKI